MSGGGSFSSDQKVLNMTTVGANTLAKTGRMRITSIQGEGIASSTIIFYDSADASSPGSAVATYNFNTEGLEVYVPGSGILFKEGLVYNLAGAGGSITITYTG
jgi:hypothetical protein|tara:strand:- start:112 stop:420 length:309 start_codon:yes stop_codon:yes gene_type:complete